MYDLVVIGAGPAGYEAAAHAGAMGRKVALVEEQALGGVCLHAGCIPTKSWLHSARLLKECREAAVYGVKTGCVEVDFPSVQKRKQEAVRLLYKGVEAKLKKSRVEVFPGRGSLVAPNKVATADGILDAANILLATGARPALPPIPGMDLPHVLDAGRLLMIETLPAALAVIGAGAIGLEFASFFAALGTKVHVIELLPRIAPNMDAELAGYLKRSLEKQGIAVNTGSRVEKIMPGIAACTDAEGNSFQVEAELVLNATGRIPNTQNLGLEQTGVEYDAKGIKTDSQGRTNVPGIWACGDATGRCQLAHAATRAAIAAVNTMFGQNDAMRYDTIPAVLYTHPEMAGVGATEQELQQKETPYTKSLLPLSVSGRYVVEQANQPGYIKVLADKVNKQLFGVHILGGPAAELIYGAALLLEAGLPVSVLARTVFPHPSVSEALKEAVLRLV